jgi:Na+/melibiose symporter-like transporter
MLGAFLIATPLILGNPQAREHAIWLALGVSGLTALAIVVCTWWLPHEPREFEGRGGGNPFSSFRDVVRNPHARLLLFVYFIEVFGIGATSAMTPYLLLYVTKAKDYVGLVFFFYTIPAAVSIPLWVSLAKRYEPHKLWRYAMGLQAIGYGTIIFQDEGRLWLMIASSILNGFAGACGQTLGYAIKGDVIDYDEYLTGERKEGAYLAAWNLASKFGTGLMIAFSEPQGGAGHSLERDGTRAHRVIEECGRNHGLQPPEPDERL